MDLDGHELRHCYSNIQAWAKKQKIPGTFSSQAMRRTVTTLAYDHHSKEEFEKVSRQQRHSLTTALSAYTAKKSKTTAVDDFNASQNVKANKIICSEALKNLQAWFGMSVRRKFPAMEDCEDVLKDKTSHKSYAEVFTLTKEWHKTLKREYVKVLARILVDLYGPRKDDSDFDREALEEEMEFGEMRKYMQKFFDALDKYTPE